MRAPDMSHALGNKDVILAVMGVTGSGKSTFISTLLGRDIGIGHGLKSCTDRVNIFEFDHKGSRIFLIDTPGFDDTFRSDIDVLKEIAFFFSNTYKKQVALGGIVYLHPISHNRVAGTDMRHLEMLQKMCGTSGYSHLVLTTTMWDKLRPATADHESAKTSENELRNTENFWGLMHAGGAKIMRFDGTVTSAFHIVDHLVETQRAKGSLVLQIQRELVDQKKDLEATCAGRELRKDIEEATGYYRTKLQQLNVEHEQALKNREEHVAKILEKQKADFEQKLADAHNAQDQLKSTIERISAEKTEEFNKLVAQVEEQQKETEALLSKKVDELKKIQRQREADAALAAAEKKRHEAEQAALKKAVNDLRMEKSKAAQKSALLDELQTDFDAQLKRQQAMHETQQASLTSKVTELENVARSRKIKWGPVCGLLAGLGITTAGLFTMNSGVLGTGLHTVYASANNL